MKVLVVCSGNSRNISPFVKEQADAIVKLGNDVVIFPIKGRGVLGYLRNVPKIMEEIKQFAPDLVHAHYGLSGLATVLQRFRPVVITFHGSDAHVAHVRALSRIASRLSSSNIFVEGGTRKKIDPAEESEVIPCGTDLEAFFPVDKKTARATLGFSLRQRYILFASRFDNKVKNYPLAVSSVQRCGADVHLIELKGKNREEVNLLLNACDVTLLTSFSEGSPQIVKEAMACNCPIVATDVGDVKWLFGHVGGCFLASYEPAEVANQLKRAMEFSKEVGRTRGRDRVIELGLDSETIARRILGVYAKVLEKPQVLRAEENRAVTRSHAEGNPW